MRRSRRALVIAVLAALVGMLALTSPAGAVRSGPELSTSPDAVLSPAASSAAQGVAPPTWVGQWVQDRIKEYGEGKKAKVHKIRKKGALQKIFAEDPITVTACVQQLPQAVAVLGPLTPVAATVPGVILFGSVAVIVAQDCVQAAAEIGASVAYEVVQGVLLLQPKDSPVRALRPGDPFPTPTPRMEVGGSLAGEWTLSRRTVTCKNTDVCHTYPLKVLFDPCSDPQCTISRPDGVWRASHLLLGYGSSGWTATMEDIGVECNGQRNPAILGLDLAVRSTEVVDGRTRAKTLIGSFTVNARTNPPDCPDNAEATYVISGVRSKG